MNKHSFLVIGLGNPEEKYNMTRHNIGFEALKYLAEKFKVGNFKLSKRLFAKVCNFCKETKKIIMALPQTYMNNSGQAVLALKKYYKISSENIIIIHDDIDIEFGKIKISKNRGSAGHKGVESIINALGNRNFIRIRIGIKPLNKDKKMIDTKKFVLKKFSAEEQKNLPKIFERIEQKLNTLLLNLKLN